MIPIKFPETRSFLPGAARISANGVLSIQVTALQWAHLTEHCDVRINAEHKTIALIHGDGRHLTDAGVGLRSLDLRCELEALGVNVGYVREFPPTLEQRKREHSRELVLRFAPEAMKRKAVKNKSIHHEGAKSAKETP